MLTIGLFAAAANLDTYITELASNSPIVGIEALLGLATLIVKLTLAQSQPEAIQKEIDTERDNEICSTEVPPRTDSQPTVSNLASLTNGEPPAPAVAHQPTARTTPDSHFPVPKPSTSGG